MFVALDAEGNRIHASDAEKGHPYFCQECGGELHLRGGPKRRLHYAHLKENKEFEHNSDYNHAWHIRMQDYFPKENREVRFVDQETGENHIADVFLADSNTVLEFQHSPILESEYISRTAFHLKNGRRMVWLFDESSQSKDSTFGRFRFDEDICWMGIPVYQWMRKPRQFLDNGPNIKQFYNLYSVCVYTGTEGDVFHRIVDQHNHFRWVGFSGDDIKMGPELNVESFFTYDPYWIREDQENARRQAVARQQEYLRQQQINNAFLQLGRRMNRRGRRF